MTQEQTVKDAQIARGRQYEMSFDDGATWYPCRAREHNGTVTVEPWPTPPITPTNGQTVLCRVTVVQEPPK